VVRTTGPRSSRQRRNVRSRPGIVHPQPLRHPTHAIEGTPIPTRRDDALRYLRTTDASQWNHDKAYYRCKFPADYGIDAQTHPKSIYVKESSVVSGLDTWLSRIFDEVHLDDTCQMLAGVSAPDPEYERRQAELRAKIADCDQRLAKYRSALDLTDEVAPFITWIAEVEKERRRYEDQLGHSVPGGTLTPSQVRKLIAELQTITEVLANADPTDKAELYRELGGSLRYHPDGSVAVEALPRGVVVRVGGGT